MIPFSILDLSPIGEGYSVRDALDQSQKMAVKAEEQGYNRVWLAEHHGMPASDAATSEMASLKRASISATSSPSCSVPS